MFYFIFIFYGKFCQLEFILTFVFFFFFFFSSIHLNQNCVFWGFFFGIRLLVVQIAIKTEAERKLVIQIKMAFILLSWKRKFLRSWIRFQLVLRYKLITNVTCIYYFYLFIYLFFGEWMVGSAFVFLLWSINDF